VLNYWDKLDEQLPTNTHTAIAQLNRDVEQCKKAIVQLSKYVDAIAWRMGSHEGHEQQPMKIVEEIEEILQ